MKVEIDISIKIEDNEDSFLGMGGACTLALRLSKREKKQLAKLTQQKENKRRKNGRNKARQRVRVYSILCFLLIEKAPKGITYVLIDRDYQGHARDIIGHIKRLLSNNRHNVNQIDFEVGDASKGDAHVVANDARKGKLPVFNISAEDVFDHY